MVVSDIRCGVRYDLTEVCVLYHLASTREGFKRGLGEDCSLDVSFEIEIVLELGQKGRHSHVGNSGTFISIEYCQLQTSLTT